MLHNQIPEIKGRRRGAGCRQHAGGQPLVTWSTRALGRRRPLAFMSLPAKEYRKQMSQSTALAELIIPRRLTAAPSFSSLAQRMQNSCLQEDTILCLFWPKMLSVQLAVRASAGQWWTQGVNLVGSPYSSGTTQCGNLLAQLSAAESPGGLEGEIRYRT